VQQEYDQLHMLELLLSLDSTLDSNIKLHLFIRCRSFHIREACFPRPIVAIGFGLVVLLALYFNGDAFLCAFSWVAQWLEALNGGRFP
jgi:hypothetical protein